MNQEAHKIVSCGEKQFINTQTGIIPDSDEYCRVDEIKQDSTPGGGGTVCKGRCYAGAGPGSLRGGHVRTGVRKEPSWNDGAGSTAGAETRSWAREEVGLSSGMRVWGRQGPRS